MREAENLYKERMSELSVDVRGKERDEVVRECVWFVVLCLCLEKSVCGMCKYFEYTSFLMQGEEGHCG